MKSRVRSFGVVMLVAVLIAGCGDGSDVVVDVDNDNNPNRPPTPIFTPTGGPTPLRTATVVPTEIEATETPAPGATETPGAEETATPAPGQTSTPGGGPTRTATPKPGATSTATNQATTTPTPQATAAATCGDGAKDSGEQCDSGTTLNAASADCAGDQQCACCLCRPTATHQNSPTTSCTTCHGVFAPVLTLPTGASDTFPASCH